MENSKFFAKYVEIIEAVKKIPTVQEFYQNMDQIPKECQIEFNSMKVDEFFNKCSNGADKETTLKLVYVIRVEYVDLLIYLLPINENTLRGDVSFSNDMGDDIYEGDLYTFNNSIETISSLDWEI